MVNSHRPIVTLLTERHVRGLRRARARSRKLTLRFFYRVLQEYLPGAHDVLFKETLRGLSFVVLVLSDDLNHALDFAEFCKQ